MKTINITPKWGETARMLIVLLQDGDPKGQEFAKQEIIRMGMLLDQFVEKAGKL